MNVTSTVQTTKKASNSENQENCCENITLTHNTFNLLFENISNKLGLSKAIYQK